jgi:hypothetical protein
MVGKQLLRKQRCSGLFILALLLGALAFINGSATAKESATPNQISAELIGHVLNPSPAASNQYGYVSYLNGIDPAALVSTGITLTEKSALLTFYTDTTTERVLNNGPLRVIDRKGEITFYLNTTPAGDFTNPASFKQGVAVLKATLRHQVVLNTGTGAFTAYFDCVVTSNEKFTLSGANYRLGKLGDPFALTVAGQLNPNGPPSAYMAGFATGLEVQARDK